MSNLKGDHRGPPRTPYPRGMTKRRTVKIPPIETNSESQEEIPPAPTSAATSTGRPPSTFSRSSSCERKMSMGSLDDVNSFQETQYLVFPIKNAGKKPTLIKFPDDLLEDNDGEHDSIWGSDTSLEEETEIAKKINAGMSLDYDEPDSPIGTPAPYIGDLES
ncbi:unnamed protein product [Strongylus vulgaris]|uniref:Uncharacterized protein n=1 Tax=Strongylus vulgaris TaxID=40348 RepID=A0A3P7J073_STRVU|nr:unnamed protein product [Strongylus vulgaris]